MAISDFYIGLILAVLSSFFIGTSFIFKKTALLRASNKFRQRAGHGSYHYLREWVWWVGIALMAIGEFCNFSAFAFAPASFVASLGALSVVVTTLLSSRCLKETLGLFGRIGCAICLLGATTIVIHAPRKNDIQTVEELQDRLWSQPFAAYVLFVAIVSTFLIWYMGPKYGQSNIFVFISICSIIGSLTVISCKGLGLTLKAALQSDSTRQWTIDGSIWFWILTVASCIGFQLNYLNRALDLFNINMVTSIYYVGFTTCVTAASLILCNEWDEFDTFQVLGSICGFLTTAIGVFQMQFFGHIEISWLQCRNSLYKANETGSESVELTAPFEKNNRIVPSAAGDNTTMTVETTSHEYEFKRSEKLT